jgi:hypothetical protein
MMMMMMMAVQLQLLHQLLLSQHCSACHASSQALFLLLFYSQAQPRSTRLPVRPPWL